MSFDTAGYRQQLESLMEQVARLRAENEALKKADAATYELAKAIVTRLEARLARAERVVGAASAVVGCIHQAMRGLCTCDSCTALRCALTPWFGAEEKA